MNFSQTNGLAIFTSDKNDGFERGEIITVKISIDDKKIIHISERSLIKDEKGVDRINYCIYDGHHCPKTFFNSLRENLKKRECTCSNFFEKIEKYIDGLDENNITPRLNSYRESIEELHRKLKETEEEYEIYKLKLKRALTLEGIDNFLENGYFTF
jgi:predicted RNase H-like nuclease (RuvC/YqgF family)